MIWDTLAFDPDDIRYSCSGVAGLHRYYSGGGKKAEYFKRLRWECPLRYEEGLSIFAEHFEKVVCGIWKANVACEDCRQALSKEIWLSKFGERCLFGFRTSNPVGDLALEIRRMVPLRFLRKQSCWESGS
ncbi:hypothetical protein ACFX1T_013383 [Malus domestica]